MEKPDKRGTAVQNRTSLSPTLLRDLHIPPITEASVITKGDRSFRPIAATQEKFTSHLAYIGRHLGMENVPATATLRILGCLRKEKKAGYVTINQTYGLYLSQRVINDIGREALPYEILTDPDQPISILSPLMDNCKDYLRTLIGEGGLWIRGMLPVIEESSPHITHPFMNMGNRVGDIIVQLQETKEIISLDLTNHTLLIPKGKLASTLGSWQCKESFGTKLRHNSFPPPSSEIAMEIWEKIFTAASE